MQGHLLHLRVRQARVFAHSRKFVSFPDIEDAKQLIKYFRAQGIMSWESMERHAPEECGWVGE